MTNILAETFGKKKQWVNYKLQKVKGKMTKIPYAITGQKASSTDPATWSTYEEAFKVSPQVGIIFTPLQDLLGIDIDHCLEGTNIVHAEKEVIERFIKEANTYCEISPSGTGLHLFLSLTEPFAPIANKHAPFELYSKGRYFTVTNNPFGEAKKVRIVSPDEAIALITILGYPWKKEEENKKIDQSELPLIPVSLSDTRVIDKMFGAKNGAEIKALARGDLSAYNNDASSGDMAYLIHLAFWTGKNAEQMERIWVSSPLGAREKVQKRKDYRDRSIAAAISKCTEVYTAQPQKEEAIEASNELDLLWTYNSRKEKVFTQNTENMCRVLTKHSDFADTLRYDVFKNVFEIRIKDKWRGLEDNDAVKIQTKISILFPFFGKVGKDMIYDAIIKVSKEHEIDSASDFIRSLKWDGTARLDSWLHHTYGVADDTYHRAVASNWVKGLIKRIIEPGCKFDYVLVLEGPQGTKKSTSLHILGGDWHIETAMSTDSKDFFMQFCGKAIVEFSEGETLSRTEVKRMKAIITMQSDKYRPPYERVSQDFPRRCIFAMTTNQSEYLKDETGNRRWLPVTVVLPEANIEWLEQNRDQIFAEAYERVIVKKEKIYEFPREETEAAQNDRMIRYENEELVVNWYTEKLNDLQRFTGITIHQVYRDALNGGMSTRPLDKYTEMRIAHVLKSALHLVGTRVMVNRVRTIRWLDPMQKDPLNEMSEIEREAAKVFDV